MCLLKEEHKEIRFCQKKRKKIELGTSELDPTTHFVGNREAREKCQIMQTIRDKMTKGPIPKRKELQGKKEVEGKPID